jgi:hypothetical protein
LSCILPAHDVDLAVWEGNCPDESNAAETFRAIHDKDIGQYFGRDASAPIPPTPAIRAYVESLRDRWYEMGDPPRCR